MVEAGVGIFFIVVPMVSAYQSGRPSALILPAALVLVSAEWVVVSDSSEHSVLGLGSAITGLALAGYVLWQVRSRRLG